MNFTMGASLHTHTRAGFIKTCHILAKGLTMPDNGSLVVGIAGSMDVGKALVADAFINALNEKESVKKYDVPYSPKMAFEFAPAQAAHFPVRGFITHNGELMPVHFVRQRDDLERLMREDKKQLIFFSDNNVCDDAHLQIDLTAPSVYSSTELLQRQWERSWVVSVVKPELMNERMSSMLSHMNSIRANQIHRQALNP
jgi:hypothetical protein